MHLQKITVGRDYGDRVEILQGVSEGTTIVAAPGDTAREGATIVPGRPLRASGYDVSGKPAALQLLFDQTDALRQRQVVASS